MSTAAASVAKIVPVHAAIPGRARLRVAGLRGSEPLKRLIEHALPEDGAIRRAEANALTGNVLVLFDRTVPLSSVVMRLELLLSERSGQRPKHGVDGHPALPRAADRPPPWHALS